MSTILNAVRAAATPPPLPPPAPPVIPPTGTSGGGGAGAPTVPPAGTSQEEERPAFPIKPPPSIWWGYAWATTTWLAVFWFGWGLIAIAIGIIGIPEPHQAAIRAPAGSLLGGLFIAWSLPLFFRYVPKLTLLLTTNRLKKEMADDGTSRAILHVRGPGLAFLLPWEKFEKTIPVTRRIIDLDEEVAAKNGGPFKATGTIGWTPRQQPLPDLIKFLQAIEELGDKGINNNIIAEVRGLMTDRVARNEVDTVLGDRATIARGITEEFKGPKRHDLEDRFGIDIDIVSFDLDPGKEILDIQNRAYSIVKTAGPIDRIEESDKRKDVLTALGITDQPRQIQETRFTLDVSSWPPELQQAAAELLRNPTAAGPLGAIAAYLATKAGGKQGRGGGGHKPPKQQQGTPPQGGSPAQTAT